MTRCRPQIFNKRRAAWLGLIGAMTASVGCQSSLHAWRKDEPSLSELIVHPQPWDAQLRGGEQHRSGESGRRSFDERSPSDRSSDERYGQSYGGRPNPYSASALAKKDRARGQSSQDQRWDEVPELDADDEAWAPYLVDVEPALRAQAKRQFIAWQIQSRNARQRDLDAEQYADDQEVDVPQTASKSRSPRSNAAVYHFRDDDREEEEVDSTPARSAKAARQTASSKSNNQATQQAYAKSSGGPAHLKFRDTDPEDQSEGPDPQDLDSRDDGRLYADTGMEQDDVPPVKQRRQAAELTPPTARKSSRQVAHAEPLDTGAGDDVRVLPKRDSQGGSAKQSSAMASKSNKRRASESPVEPASHESDDQASAVVPASGTRPIQKRPVEAPVSESNQRSGQSTEEHSPKSKKLSSNDHLNQALQCMDEEWSDSLTPSEQLHHQAVKRLVSLAAGRFDAAMEPIESLGLDEQEFFRHDLQAWQHAIDPKGHPVLARRWPLVMDSHREAFSHMAAVSSLEVKHAAFCSNVDGFGSITKFPTAQFRAGQEVLLYCEIDNFVSEPVKDGFETKLQGNYEIVDSNNVKMAEQLLPQDAEVCSRARRDYFLVYRIYMPSKIQAGRYQLRLTIEDMKGKKFGLSSLDFQVGT